MYLWSEVWGPEVLADGWTVKHVWGPGSEWRGCVYTDTATGEEVHREKLAPPLMTRLPGRHSSVLDRWAGGAWAAHKHEVGTATHILSYPWSMPFEDVVQAVTDAFDLDSNKDDVYIFFDCLQEAGVHYSDNIFTAPESLEHVMQSMRGVVQVSSTWNDPERLKRLWMMLECCLAVVNEVQITLALPPRERAAMSEALEKTGPSAVLEIFYDTCLDPEQAICATSADTQRLRPFLESLIQRGGGREKVELKLADATRQACAQSVLLRYEELKRDYSGIGELRMLDLGHQLAKLWALTDDIARAEALFREVIAALRNVGVETAAALMARAKADNVIARLDTTSAELMKLLNDAGQPEAAHTVERAVGASGELAISFDGVSVDFLCKFEDEHKEAINFLSTDAVTERILKPLSKSTKLYDPEPKGQAVIEMAHNHYISKPKYFISHAWRQTFSVNAGPATAYRGGFVQAMLQKVPEAERSTTFIWHDIFCVNQHLLSPYGGLLAFAFDPLRNAISSCECVLLFMETWDDPAPLGRVWCLEELRTAILFGKRVEVVLPGPAIKTLQARARDERQCLLEDINRVVDRVDIDHAAATFRRDRNYVLQMVRSTIGAEALNLFCKCIIRDALISAAGLEEVPNGSQDTESMFDSMLDARKGMDVPQKIEVTRAVAMMMIRTTTTTHATARALINETMQMALRFYGERSQLVQDLRKSEQEYFGS